MRKRLARLPESQDPSRDDGSWDLERLARVEITSEEPGHPIEAALLTSARVAVTEVAWKAAEPGPQTVRVIFDEPQHLRRIELAFVEPAVSRTQEFVLRWSPDNGRTFVDIVRQQWNFSPPGTVREVETYRVDLLNLTVLELSIVPDVSGGPARASLSRLRLA